MQQIIKIVVKINNVQWLAEKLDFFSNCFTKITYLKVWLDMKHYQNTIHSDSSKYSENILTVLSTAFGSITFPTVIWLCMLPYKTAIDLKLYSAM